MREWWRANRIACVSVLIAACALGLGVFEGYQQRKHARLSVQPYLEMRFSAYPNVQVPGIGLYVYNGGLGPAWITDVTVYLDGSVVSFSRLVESLANEWIANVTETGREGMESQKDFRVSQSNLDEMEKCAILQGEFVLMFEIREEDWTSSRGEFLKEFFARTAVDLSYESVYGESFQLSQGAEQEGR